MNLAEAIFNACQDRFSRRYRIEQAVIYLVWDPKHAEIAEIGWSKLTETLQEGYTEMQSVESMARESLRLCKLMEETLDDDVIKIEEKETGA